jgi:SAM-dependent methyltransferase
MKRWTPNAHTVVDAQAYDCDRFWRGAMNLNLFSQYRMLFRKQLRRKLVKRTISCPLCGCAQFTLLCKHPNVNMRFFREIFAEKVVACRACGFVWTNPQAASEALEKYYSEDYLLEGLNVPRSVEEFLNEAYKEIWFSKDRDLQLILEQKDHGRLLDIGCASGTLLWLASRQGFAVFGVEVAHRSADFVKNILGFEVFCGELKNAAFASSSFDVVTMFHSLEHVPDPRQVIREIHRILASDGVFIGVVPNFGGWSSQKFGPAWIWLQPQNHYSHFTPESLGKLLEAENFTAEIRSEEGRYGDEEIRKYFDQAEINEIVSQRKSSELLFVARKARQTTEGQNC